MKLIPIRETFKSVVRKVGGEVVDDQLKDDGSLPKNADFVFRNECCIAELKCLESNLLDTPAFIQKFDRLYTSWIEKGLVCPPIGNRVTVRARDLPRPCALQLVDLIKPMIERRVRDANSQIKASKQLHGMTNARGLFIIANDGNYSLGHEAVVNLIARCLRGSMHRAIDSIIYFTANMPSAIPGDERDFEVWLPAYRNDDPSADLSSLSKCLFNAWRDEVEMIWGGRIDIVNASSPAMLDAITYR